MLALADLNRHDHDHAPGAALAEAPCTGGGNPVAGRCSRRANAAPAAELKTNHRVPREHLVM